MNCLEYRRQIEAAPAQRAESLSQHAADCAACKEFTRMILRLDQRINDAITVPVPENLEARILLRQSFQQNQTPSWTRRIAWSMVAGMLLIIGLTTTSSYLYFNQQSELENDIISVVNSANDAMQARGPVSTAQISKEFEPLGFNISDRLGKVSFAGKCLVQGEVAGHMILRRNGQPITLIFFPNRSQLRQASFSSKQWQGLLVPVASGTVAIVAPPELALGKLSEQVKKLVHWNTAA